MIRHSKSLPRSWACLMYFTESIKSNIVRINFIIWKPIYPFILETSFDKLFTFKVTVLKQWLSTYWSSVCLHHSASVCLSVLWLWNLWCFYVLSILGTKCLGIIKNSLSFSSNICLSIFSLNICVTFSLLAMFW